MAKRVALPQSKLKKRRRVRRVRLGIVLGVLALLLCGAAIGLSWLPAIRIASIHISGTETIATSTIERVVQEKVEGRYFFIIPKDNIFLYPKEEIRGALRAQYPVLASARVAAENFETLKIEVAERKPSALWCGQSPEAAEGCQLMDATGFAYTPAANFSGDAYFSYYGPATTTLGFVGAQPLQFLTPGQFSALAALAKAFADNQTGTRILRVVVEQNGDAKISFENGFSVLFLLSGSGGNVFEQFTLALQSEPFKQHPISDFEYLDLRFGDKLYYHLKTK